MDVRAFTGQAKFCKKAAAGYSNCCKDSGWGQDIGLAKCSSDEKALAKAKIKQTDRQCRRVLFEESAGCLPWRKNAVTVSLIRSWRR
ncbi:conjugal transfer protein TraN [Escherichia coli]|nr:conjugal transfer protein TraN [Escherichia coli]